MPICQVCLKSFQNLTSHINAKHNLNKSSYYSLYPGAELIDKELSKKFSDRAKQTHKQLKEADPVEYSRVRRQTCETMRNKKGKDFRHSDETKEKMSASHTGQARAPHTEETKAKLSQAKTGKPLKLSDEAKKSKSEKQKQRWQERKGNTAEFAEYISALSKARKEYILLNGVSLPKKGKKTSIETRFELFLIDHGIEYKFQYFLNGKYYDFYLPLTNMLIEVDGEYWHRFPRAIKNDLEKHVIAKDANIRLLRLTEKVWDPGLIFESDYSKIQLHNFNILNKRTVECLDYKLSVSMI
jgi:hypothetical protein